MGMTSSELSRSDFTTHEIYVLRYAQQNRAIPADPVTVATLVEEQLITETKEQGIHQLTSLGRFACAMLRGQFENLSI